MLNDLKKSWSESPVREPISIENEGSKHGCQVFSVISRDVLLEAFDFRD